MLNAYLPRVPNRVERVGVTSDFPVTFSQKAQNVIAEASRFALDGSLFPGVRKGVESDMTMSNLLERRGIVGRPRGIGASFRDRVAETANIHFVTTSG